LGSGFGTATAGGGRDGQLGCGPGCRHWNPESFPRRTSYICLPFLTFETLVFLKHIFPGCFQGRIYGCFNFSGCKFKVIMNNNNVKYLRVISFSQLTLAWKTEIKNLGRAATDLDIQGVSKRALQL
jgi:hypothetical protein